MSVTLTISNSIRLLLRQDPVDLHKASGFIMDDKVLATLALCSGRPTSLFEEERMQHKSSYVRRQWGGLNCGHMTHLWPSHSMFAVALLRLWTLAIDCYTEWRRLLCNVGVSQAQYCPTAFGKPTLKSVLYPLLASCYRILDEELLSSGRHANCEVRVLSRQSRGWEAPCSDCQANVDIANSRVRTPKEAGLVQETTGYVVRGSTNRG